MDADATELVGVPVMAPGIGAGAAVLAGSAAAATPAGSPSVRFGEGRRPESALQVQVAEFEGPLALLLSLIEARQLDVLTVPLGGLAAVTWRKRPPVPADG